MEQGIEEDGNVLGAGLAWSAGATLLTTDSLVCVCVFLHVYTQGTLVYTIIVTSKGLFVESAQNFYSQEILGQAQTQACNGHPSIVVTTIILLNLATYSPDISDNVRMWNGLYAEERMWTVKIKVLNKWMGFK